MHSTNIHVVSEALEDGVSINCIWKPTINICSVNCLKQNLMFCRKMLSKAEKEFWGCPKLIEILLPFLDTYSIICLAQVNTPSQISHTTPNTKYTIPKFKVQPIQNQFLLSFPSWTPTPSSALPRPTSLPWVSSWTNLCGAGWSRGCATGRGPSNPQTKRKSSSRWGFRWRALWIVDLLKESCIYIYTKPMDDLYF